MLPTAGAWLSVEKRGSRMPSQRQGFPPWLRFNFCQQLGYQPLISGPDHVVLILSQYISG